MATVRGSAVPAAVPVEPGKVNEVRAQFLLQGDEGLANRLQQEEFGIKYNRNRNERQLARQDVPLAKVVYSEEEERLQRERFERLEQEKLRADEDARIARQLEREEQLRKNHDNIHEADVQLAKEMQREELKHLRMAEDDARIALELQKEELIKKRNEDRQRQMEDQSVAQRLQEREHRLAELIKTERELRHQQRVSQHVQQPDEFDAWFDEPRLHSQPAAIVVTREETEDDTFNTDRDEQLYAQDRELARALQELELDQMNARRQANNEQLYDTVRSDARLAKIMQEQERLAALRRAEERRIRRAAREYNEHAHHQGVLRRVQSDDSYTHSILPPPYDPPPVPRYTDPAARGVPRQGHSHEARYVDPPLNAHGHHTCQHNVVDTCAHGHVMQPNTSPQPCHHHHHAAGSPTLPPDFLRLDLDPASQNCARDGRHVCDPNQRVANGPVYIGPVGRTTSLRDQRPADQWQRDSNESQQQRGVRDASEPLSQRPVARTSSSKSNCKQQ